MTDKKQLDRITNRKFSEDGNFRKACQKANVAPTRRQASKFRRGEGKAFKASREND
jgi:hypothetical protein